MGWWLVLLVSSYWNPDDSREILLVVTGQLVVLVILFDTRMLFRLDFGGWNLLGLEKL